MVPPQVPQHRLHHKFTDDPVHDPYAATRGLFYSHIGCSVAAQMSSNRVHLSGFYCACPLGTLCGDPAGAFVWGGLLLAVITAGEGSHNFCLQLIAVPKAQIGNLLFWDVFKEFPVSHDRKEVAKIFYIWRAGFEGSFWGSIQSAGI
ncbi:hypothetical protein B0H13DRAFT_2288909 [Mycena leptocephala]|nr:hypothetical protein B0H13DRAFT_2288909 [Mycena leptocephala]